MIERRAHLYIKSGKVFLRKRGFIRAAGRINGSRRIIRIDDQDLLMGEKEKGGV